MMAQDLGSPLAEPRMGIQGNPQSLPQLERQVTTQAESSPVDYQSTLTGLAFTPTALGELGSKLMQTSSDALAMRFGQYLGNNPKGNLIPPITNFDKTMTEAYTAQAQTTIGLQANDYLQKGAEQLSKQNKLSPDAIQAYTKNMALGLQDMINLAPDSIKPQLESQYGNHLINTTHQFNERMIGQQKSDAASKDSAWRSHQADAIQNAVKDGNVKLAEQMRSSLEQNIKAAYSAGTMSAADSQTALTASKLNYESAKSIRTWMDAKSSGTEAEYLKSISDRKIEGLTWSESETVRDNTLKHANSVEAAENRNESLFMAQGQQEIALGSFNQDRANFFKENLRPLQYTRLMTQYAIQNHKNGTENVAVQGIISRPDSSSSYVGASKKQINTAYQQLVNTAKQKADVNGQPISQEDAEYQAAGIMATPVPAVIDKINRGLKNGNAQEALQSLQMFERLHALEGNKTIGVDEKSLAVAEVFQDLLASNPGNPEGALQLAKDTVLNKDEKIVKMNNLRISQYYQKHATDAAHALSNAVNISGVSGNGANIDNPAGFTADINSRFNGYMQLTNGDEEQSKKLVARDVSKVWGVTEVNGKRELTRLPVEGMIHIPKGATPLIHQDIIDQLTPQLKQSEIAHAEGKLPYYWRLKEGRVSYDDYVKAKAEIEEKMNTKSVVKAIRGGDELSEIKGEQSSFAALRASLASQRKIVETFESGKPIEIEQVFSKDQIKTFNINIQTSNWATISPKTGNVEGGTNMMVVDPETGIRTAMVGYYGSTKTQAQYIPNAEKITNRFISVNGLAQKPIEQLEREYQIQTKALENIVTANSAGAF